MSRFTKLFEIFDRHEPVQTASSGIHSEVTRELCLSEITEVAEQDARAEQLWDEFEAKHRPWSVRKA